MEKVFRKAYSLFQNQGLLNKINNYSHLYYDEPAFFNYISDISLNTQQLDKPEKYYSYLTNTLASGTSFESSSQALTKCLSETAERICLYLYPIKKIYFGSSLKLGQSALDLGLYANGPEFIRKRLGWTKGINLFDQSLVSIPAQLVYLQYYHYLMYIKNGQERILAPVNSNGAASGKSKTESILRGLYETIERDAAMTFFLIKAQAPKIDISLINNPKIQRILDNYQRYHLDWQLFEITNDIGVPSFLSLLIDRSGIGPALSAGVKTNLSALQAILGSAEEALAARISARNTLIKNNSLATNDDDFIIDNWQMRSKYWSRLDNLSQLDFLLNQKPQKLKPDRITIRNINLNQQLKSLTKIMQKQFQAVFAVDITLPFCKQIGLSVNKVIAPELQPFYLNEAHRDLNQTRLNQVSDFYHQPKLVINSSPHFYI